MLRRQPLIRLLRSHLLRQGEKVPLPHCSALPPLVSREAFAKISEVEGIRLSEAEKAMFADFDRRNLSPEERRHAIMEQFRRDATE